MGDRANVVFKQENGSYLGVYLHNSGYQQKEVTARAIQRVIQAGRQTDESYANRIAVSEIIGLGWKRDLDYGLCAAATLEDAIGDNQYDVLEVDWKARKVRVHDYSKWKLGGIKAEYTFSDFLQGGIL